MAPPHPPPLPLSRPTNHGDALVVAAYRAGGILARAVPGPVATLVGRGLAVGLASTMEDKRKMIGRHLARVLGRPLGPLERRALVAQAFDSYARYWVEVFRLPSLTAAELDAGMSWSGLSGLSDALARGRGAILALPHLGGWDWAGGWLAGIGVSPAVVVEALEPPELFEWFADFRRSIGMDVIALGPGAGGEVLAALGANRAVSLVCDRDVGGGGVAVEFFGERTTLPGGPATLALRSGAALLPTAIYFEGAGHLGVVRPPVPVVREGRFRDDVIRVTQALAFELEALIRAAPEQWHMMQPNWPSDHAVLAARG